MMTLIRVALSMEIRKCILLIERRASIKDKMKPLPKHHHMCYPYARGKRRGDKIYNSVVMKLLNDTKYLELIVILNIII